VLLCNHLAWRGTGLALVAGAASAAFALVAFGTTGLAIGLAFIPLAWIVATSLAQVELPLIDVVAVRASRDTAPHYGHYRGLGTAAYMAANLVGGATVATLGSNFIIFWCLATTLCGAVVALTMPRRSWNRSRRTGQRLPWRQAGTLLRYPAFLAILVIGGLIELSHVYFYSFSSLLWQSEGMSPFTIGLLRAVCALAEVVFLFRFEPWCRRIGPWRLLLIAASASILRWTAMAFTPPLWAELLLQTLHALSYTGTFVAALRLVEATVDEELFPVGQSVCVAFISGFVPGIGTLLCGMLHDRLGAYGYFAMTMSAILALIAVLATSKWLSLSP
jgi:PPP family 3-phenylpropionic acid transporter